MATRRRSMPPQGSMPAYVYKVAKGFGLERFFSMRSRKRAHWGMWKPHEHEVQHDPMERPMVLTCNCPGYQYRRVCAGTRPFLRGRLP